MIEFIFMLTRDDVTLPDAREVYAAVAGTGVRHVGCKDVGLPKDELAALMEDIRAHGHASYLEVVSETPEDTLQSAAAAGRPLTPPQAPCARARRWSRAREPRGAPEVIFSPYVGRIVGHPCLLRG